jgi:hypothetical protein
MLQGIDAMWIRNEDGVKEVRFLYHVTVSYHPAALYDTDLQLGDCSDIVFTRTTGPSPATHPSTALPAKVLQS